MTVQPSRNGRQQTPDVTSFELWHPRHTNRSAEGASTPRPCTPPRASPHHLPVDKQDAVRINLHDPYVVIMISRALGTDLRQRLKRSASPGHVSCDDFPPVMANIAVCFRDMAKEAWSSGTCWNSPTDAMASTLLDRAVDNAQSQIANLPLRVDLRYVLASQNRSSWRSPWAHPTTSTHPGHNL